MLDIKHKLILGNSEIFKYKPNTIVQKFCKHHSNTCVHT